MTEDAPVRLLTLFHALEDHCEEVERLARQLMEIAKREASCSRADLLRDLQDVTQFAMFLDFPSEDSLESYLGNEARRAALKDLPDLIHEDIRRVALSPVPTRTDA